MNKFSQKFPLVSIITVVFNGKKFLEDSIKSVLKQEYPNLEYLLVDGGSTDGTLELIKKYENHIDHWISEPDRGIYDAMNKGSKIARGDWIWFLNADDRLYEGAIQKLFSNNSELASYGGVYGAVRILEPEFSYLWGERNLSGEKYPINFNHPATAIRMEVFNKYGGFDLKYQLSSDYDFFLRLVKAGTRFHYVNQPIAEMRKGGAGDVLKSQMKRGREHFIIDKNLSGKKAAIVLAIKFHLWLFFCKVIKITSYFFGIEYTYKALFLL